MVRFYQGNDLLIQDAEVSDMGQTDRVVMIGTASKGIIDRQHQHNAQVYFTVRGLACILLHLMVWNKGLSVGNFS